MALILKKESLPGYKTAKAIYDKIPGGGIVKKILVGAAVGAVIVGALAAGAIGIAALLSAVGGSLLGSSLLAAGIIAAIPAVIGLIGTAGRTLYSFNWNVSDKELDQELKSSLESLYSQLGSAAGSAVGWLVCGILPGAVTFAFNPAVARMVMADMAQEAQEEVWGTLASCRQGAIALLASAMMKKGYQSARRWLKRPDSPFYGFLKEHFGERFDKWGQDNQPSFSFSQYTEDRIEEIPDPGVRNFTEEFVDSLFDSCNEALQNLSNSMRTNMAAYALMQKQQTAVQSQNLTVQIDFSRSDDSSSAPSTP